ncbi:C6 finger domain-containing protein [Paraphaeosphaeria sporulosa]
MSSPFSPTSNLRRKRTVEGSCWPCKQRRIKCDLTKPACHRCIASGTEDCSYDKLLLRWKKRPSKSMPETTQQSLLVHRSLNDMSLATNERRAVDYFKGRLWPLFSTVHEPIPPPVALALRSQPVLQALCVFAEEHRALQEKGQAQHTLENRRLHCLTVIRGELGLEQTETASLSALLVAVLLLYFLEGYVNCAGDDASTPCHASGASAILDALGGFDAAYMSSDKMTRMLLSEFASTDLTEAMMQDRRTRFPSVIWARMEPGSVWWESPLGNRSLATVLGTMADMTSYRQDVKEGTEPCNEMIQAFERALQPSFSMLEHSAEEQKPLGLKCDLFDAVTASSLSLNRSFQHAGLIYLYSAILHIPIHHFLVQQHVHACLECIQGMDPKTKVQNCALFPLYVAGAHAISGPHKATVLEKLDVIYKNLRFESVTCVRMTLEQIWTTSSHTSTWNDLFKGVSPYALVI